MCFIYVHEKITMVTTVCVFDVVNGCEWGMFNIQCYGWYVQKTWPSYWCIGWLILCLMLKILLSLLLFEAKNNKPQESSIFDRKNLGFHKKDVSFNQTIPNKKKLGRHGTPVVVSVVGRRERCGASAPGTLTGTTAWLVKYKWIIQGISGCHFRSV